MMSWRNYRSYVKRSITVEVVFIIMCVITSIKTVRQFLTLNENETIIIK
jgi:hypothetical protein